MWYIVFEWQIQASFPCSLQQLPPEDAPGVQLPDVTGMLPWQAMGWQNSMHTLAR